MKELPLDKVQLRLKKLPVLGALYANLSARPQKVIIYEETNDLYQTTETNKKKNELKCRFKKNTLTSS